MGEIFLRLDVEDWLTPAADWALERILEDLDNLGARANFAVVGLKARALVGRGKTADLRRMARTGSVGYHSYSHSVHPTLAEDLEPRERADARRRFLAREQPGVDVLRRAGTPPVFFTQPGANWVPEVLEEGQKLGLRAFVSEAWNSYLKPSRQLFWLGSVLYWAPPVDMPKGFLFGLPDGVGEAAATVADALARGETAMVVTHPTELVTRRFWDQDNFAAGRTERPAVPGAALPAALWEPRARALHEYWQRLADLHPTWVTVDDWLSAVEPPGPVAVDRTTLVEGLKRWGLGPLPADGGCLSAAEAVLAVAQLGEGAGDVISVPRLLAPEGEAAGIADMMAGALARGRLPARVGDRDVLSWSLDLMERVVGFRPRVAFVDYVRPPEEQHWDWPIFRPGFRADRLWREAVTQAWTLKPARLVQATGGNEHVGG